MDDLELSLLVSLYVILIHALIESRPIIQDASEHMLLEFGASESNRVSLHNNLQMALSTVALYDHRMSCGLLCFEDDLKYWVKPRSTAWFSEFLMNVYDDDRWIQNFRMGKAEVAMICNRVRRYVVKLDTKFRKAIPVEIRVCCTLFKLAQGANILSCSEQFAIGKSTVGKVIREVVAAINIEYKSLIQWPQGARMLIVMEEFRAWCGMPSIHGAIDGTHIEISKPALFPEDYYYYKNGCYTMVAQAVVDCNKRFIDVFVGLPGSVNDSRVLRKSGLYNKVQNQGLMNIDRGCQDGVPPYLLGDKGYPLLSWILTPYKEDRQPRTVLELLYNKRHKRGRSVVENAFGLMKQTWREMITKTELDVKIVPDVFVCCCLLHNLVQSQQQSDIEALMQVLAYEATREVRARDRGHNAMDWEATFEQHQRLENGERPGDDQRRLVEAYLGTHRPGQH